MQLIVLGMHRSGTSMVARLLNMMGAYFGAEGSSTGFSAENPKGFWERRDIRNLNDRALFAVNADWYKVADFDVTKLPDHVKEEYTKTAKSLIHELDTHRPWVIKEPRLCLLFPILRPLLEIPVCVHVYRNPLQVAQSLKTRNGFPIHFGIALWEKYNLSALSVTQGLPNLLVSYSQLIEQPVETVQLLFEDLNSLGVQGLRCPNDKEIQAFIDPALFRERDDAHLMDEEFLNRAQIKLFKAFEERSVFNFELIPPLSVGALKALKDYQVQEDKATKLRESLAEKKEEAQILQAGINERDEALKKRDEELTDIQRDLAESKESEARQKEEVERLQSEPREQSQDIKQLIRWIKQLDHDIEAFKGYLLEKDRTIVDLTHGLAAKDREKAEAQRKTEDFRLDINNKNEHLILKEKELERRSNEIQKLARWIEKLEHDIEALLNSLGWKVGNAIGELGRRVMFKSRVPMAVDHIRELCGQIDEWKKKLSGRKKTDKEEPPSQEHLSTCIREEKNQTSPESQIAKPKENVVSSEESMAGRVHYHLKRSISLKTTSINIIIYFHKDLEGLRNTLISLKNNTDCSKHNIYLIDDSDMPHISNKVAKYCEGIENLNLIKSQKHVGYLHCVSNTLKKIEDGDMCLAIGNVVFTPHWLEGMAKCNERIDDAGFVSPLTNTSPYYGFELNQGDNIFSAAEKISKLSLQEYPAIPLPDAHLFLMKRRLFDKISSLLDSLVTAENNEISALYKFFLAAYKHNFVSVIADDVFVYISNTKCHINREIHARIKKHLNRQTTKLLKTVEKLHKLSGVDVLKKYNDSDMTIINPRTVIIFLNSIVVRGGVFILTQLANDLILKGVDVKCFHFLPKSYEPETFDLFFEPIVYVDEEHAESIIPDHSVLLATFWTTTFIVDKIKTKRPSVHRYYFIQDFEMFFYDTSNPEQAKLCNQAGESYNLNLRMLTSSDWIAQQIRSFIEKPNYPIRKIPLGINHEIFYPEKIEHSTKDIRVIAMARPETPRRGFSDLINVFTRVHEIDPSIEFCFFGTNDLDDYDIRFPYVNYGVQSLEKLRGLYNISDIYIDTSLFQGFGLTGLEAMACGCACVLTDSGAIHEYARHEINALIEKPGDIEALANAIISLAKDEKLRNELVAQSLETAQNFSNHDTADALYEIIEHHLSKKNDRIKKKTKDKTCNIIIPVYNELHFVRLCLESIEKYTDYPYRVCIVDDGSDKSTKEYLREVVGKHDNFYLIENEKNIGFVASCNRGMAATDTGDLLLLNSDIVVTPGWLSKIVSCAYSDDNIGIVSPLTTRSSHLWVNINPGENIFTTASKIDKLSEKKYPDIVTPEGWCFLIKREAYERLGQFDTIFGKGYCEESDFSMRALCNNYRTVCADNTFIFHKGQVTFKGERGERYKKNRAIFDKRWGHYHQKVYKEFLSTDPLQYIRAKYEASSNTNYLTLPQAKRRTYKEVITILEDMHLDSSVESYKKIVSSQVISNGNLPNSNSVVFLLSTFEKYGGVISVTQLVNDLILMGVDARVVVINPKKYDEDIFLLTVPIIYESTDSMVEHFPMAKYIVATLWITTYYMVKIVERHKHLKPYYFIQDYELYFYDEKENEVRQKIIDTYGFPARRFAKTNWIIDKVSVHGAHVHKVPPALDLEIFYPRDRSPKDSFVILTMMRPSTKYRGFDSLVRVLTQIVRQNKDVQIHTFGTGEQELREYSTPFQYVNHGRLAQAQLAQVYSNADLYVDFSTFHGFGRTALEAMACGTCCVLTNSGGVREYAVDGFNCLMSAPGDIKSLVTNIQRIAFDRSLRETLVKNGLETVRKYERTYSSQKTWEHISNDYKNSGA